MTLMLYNYLKLEAFRTRLDMKEQKETHGELLNLISTQILVKKMPLDLESITLLLQSIRQVRLALSNQVSKMIPNLEQYALKVLDEEELMQSLELFKQTENKLGFMQQQRLVGQRVTKLTMLMTALLHEDLDMDSQSLIKTDLDKIQNIVTSILADMQKALIIKHDGISLIDSLPLLTVDNTLIDICFDWHPNHVGVKAFPLHTLAETNLHDLLLDAINKRLIDLSSEDIGTVVQSQRREDVTLTATTLKKYLYFK